MPAPLPDGITLVPFSRYYAIAGRNLMKRVYVDLNDGGISEDGWWEWLTSDDEFDPELFFIAIDRDAVVGFCHCWSVPFIKDLVVDPSWRQRGLGTALLTRAMQAFVARGATSVDLKTDVDNEKAQSLYRRLGFVIVGRIP